MSLFEDVERVPPDPIFGLASRFNKDKNTEKVDLTVGIYRNLDLKTRTMRSVLDAEKKLMQVEENKTYLPIEGEAAFIHCSQDLVFGADFCKSASGRLFGVQTIGGTGGLRLGGEFLSREVTKNIYVSDPTWPNHRAIFEACGMQVESYPYYNYETHTIEYESMLHFFSQIPEKSVVVLHACCHNPTGTDLNQSQWRELSNLFLQRKIIPFFDCAYQGFGRGIEEDAWAMRYFAEQGHEMFVAASYSKNFGLYGERIGCLSGLTQNNQVSQNVVSVLKRLVRSMYSNPPRHGAGIVATILQDAGLKTLWMGEVDQMRERIETSRLELATSLAAQFGKERFDFLKRGKGLFSLLGLKKDQVERMMDDYAVYCNGSSRLNLTGLSLENLPYVIESIVKTS